MKKLTKNEKIALFNNFIDIIKIILLYLNEEFRNAINDKSFKINDDIVDCCFRLLNKHMKKDILLKDCKHILTENQKNTLNCLYTSDVDLVNYNESVYDIMEIIRSYYVNLIQNDKKNIRNYGKSQFYDMFLSDIFTCIVVSKMDFIEFIFKTDIYQNYMKILYDKTQDNIVFDEFFHRKAIVNDDSIRLDVGSYHVLLKYIIELVVICYKIATSKPFDIDKFKRMKKINKLLPLSIDRYKNIPLINYFLNKTDKNFDKNISKKQLENFCDEKSIIELAKIDYYTTFFKKSFLDMLNKDNLVNIDLTHIKKLFNFLFKINDMLRLDEYNTSADDVNAQFKHMSEAETDNTRQILDIMRKLLILHDNKKI